MTIETEQPTVSVILITYAHEGFIAQAVESVLLQETRFPVEILVSEDASPDTTRAIVEQLQREYPGRIRLFLSARNRNDNEVLTRAWEAARGRYIALLDGDDYWTDRGKLQKQVDFMESHPDIFVCGHAVSLVDAKGSLLQKRFRVDEERTLAPEDLASGYCFHTASVLFRNNGAIPPRELFWDVLNADNLMYAYFANFGGGYVSAEIMAAYRLHPGGVWSTLDKKTAADHRNKTLSRIPHVLRPGLKSVGYAAFLWHSLHEDYRWRRRVRNIPYALAMTLASLDRNAARYLVSRAKQRVMRRLRS